MSQVHGESRPPPRTLVLGGAGFIGRHAVASLLERGVPVTIGSRHPARVASRLPPVAHACPRLHVRFEDMLARAQWKSLLVDIDVVVNCVGILRPRGRETYDRVHHLAPAALAASCRDGGVRLLHVSALGLQGDCHSGFLRSKQQGEAAVRASGVHGGIIRPSLLDGPAGGYGARWIRRVARWPMLALPVDATGRIAALDVRDLGDALATLAIEPGSPSLREYEFGGPVSLPLRDYVGMLRQGFGLNPARVFDLPPWLARLLAHGCDLLHVTPYSNGHLELLRRDNCPSRNDLPEVLRRPLRLPGEMPPSRPLSRPAAAPA